MPTARSARVRKSAGLLTGTTLLLIGCRDTQPAQTSPPARPAAQQARTQPSRAEPTEAREAAREQAASTQPTPFDCKPLSCREFATPAAALLAALAPGTRALGLGEAHTPAHFQERSTVRRFAEDLLPALSPSVHRLLVELLAPPVGCDSASKAAQQEADAVTEGQAGTNQNEYVALGQAARTLGIVPDILHPTCADMTKVQQAEVGVLALMEIIARLSVQTAEGWLARPHPARNLLVLYGGALHNDLTPRGDLQTWSYGPALASLTGDTYVEVDLVIPELMQDTDSWRKFSWYSSARALPPGHGTVLIEVAERSFALVFAAATGLSQAPAGP